MNELRVPQNGVESIMHEPLAGLERMYIEIYLRGQGHTWRSLRQLPEKEAKLLMARASLYASTKLAEVETRAQFLQEIHGTAPPM